MADRQLYGSYNKVITLVTLLTLTLVPVLSADPIPSTESSSPQRSSSGFRLKSSQSVRRRGRTNSQGVTIEKISACSALVDGRLINLTPLGDTTFKPGYEAEVGGWTYSFNPCFPFNVPENPYTALEDQCDFVAMCKSKKTDIGHVAYTLGIQQTAVFQMQPPPGGAPLLMTSSSPVEPQKTPSEEPNSEIYIDNSGNGQQEGGEENGEGKGSIGVEGEEKEEEDTGEDELVSDEGEEEEKMADSQVEKRNQNVLGKAGVEGEGSGDDGTPVGDQEEGEEEGEEEEEEEESGDEDDDDDDDDEDDEAEEEEEEEVSPEGDADNGHIGEAGHAPSSAPPPRKTRRHSRINGRKGRSRTRDDGTRQRREVGDQPPQGSRKRKGPTSIQSPSLQNLTVDHTQARAILQGHNTITETPRVVSGDSHVAKEDKSVKRRMSHRRQRLKGGLQASGRRDRRMELALTLSGIRQLRRQRTYIFLVCDTKGRASDRAQFSFLEAKHSKMLFEFRHVCCCPDACTNTAVRLGASRDGPEGEVPVKGGSKVWPPHQLLWAIVAVFLIIVMAIVIGTACCRTGGAQGPYTMLPGLHSSRLTISSMESVRMSNHQKFPSPDYLDYASPKLRQSQYPQFENGIVPASELEIGQRLGGGLFGDTYLGNICDRHVAAKRITVGVHKGQMTDADRAWLADVVSKLMKLQHKNIVTVLGICLDLRQPHVIKEYIEGSSLRDLLVNQEDGSLTYNRKIRMLAQAAEGLQYLHSTRYVILHRDLRCANLLVSKYDDQVKITDFGMVQVLHKLRIQCTGRDGCYCRKLTPAFPASIRWTAPEILRHPTSDEATSGIYSPACDVYSFGMTMWEAMNVADPWSEIVDEETVIDMVLRGSRPDATALQGMPDAHVNLMKACWTEAPEKRPSSKQILSHLAVVMKQLSKDGRRRERRDSESSMMNYFRSALNLANQ